MSLIARYLEEHGIPTVVIGTARDIVESANVPRFLFVDFPLGNPCGEPWDVDQQRAIFEQALEPVLETATEPGHHGAGRLSNGASGEKWKETDLHRGAAVPLAATPRPNGWRARRSTGSSAPKERSDVRDPAAPREVIVYTTPFCAPCEQALKRFLKDNGVAFTVRDLMMDEDAQDRLEERGIRSTPALEVDGEIYAGEKLDPARVRELVGIGSSAFSLSGASR